MMKILKYLLYGLVLTGAVFFVFVNLFNAPGRSEEETRRKEGAETIVKALAAYMAEEGKYPESLDVLIPDFVEAIPTGKSSANIFEYKALPERKNFRLSYPEAPIGMLPSDGFHTYRSQTGAWEFKVY